MKRVGLSLAGTALAVAVVGGLSAKPSYSDEIGKVIDNAIQSDPYIALMVGQDSYVYLSYNKTGEVLAESSEGGVAFYLKDNSIVTVSDTEVKKDYDLDTLDFVRNTVLVADELSNKDNATASIEVKDLTQEMIESEKEKRKLTDEDINNFPKYKLYTINLKGTDTIKKVYEKVNEQYANESIESIQNSFEGTDPKDINMVMRVRTSEDGDLGVACEFQIGEDTYTNWVFTSYMKTNVDWEFGEDWYNTDIKEHTKWVEMVTDKISEVSGKLLEFVESEREKNDSTRTGKIDYDTYSKMDESKKIEAVRNIVADLKDLGTEIKVDEKEFIGKIDKYYESEDTRGVKLLQAAINIGVRDNLINMDTVKGENGASEGTEASEGTGASEGTEDKVEIVG